MIASFPWTLEVEGLGKLRCAKVQPRPLMLFVGDNNSGKSYLASLLWGVLCASELWKVVEGSSLAGRCVEWSKQFLDRTKLPLEFTLEDNDIELLMEWANELWTANKDRFVQAVFNAKEMSVGNLRLEYFGGPRRCRVEEVYSNLDGMIYWKRGPKSEPDLIMEIDDLDVTGHNPLSVALAFIFALLSDSFAPAYASWIGAENIAFLPASRTGFMLTYKAVVKQQLRNLAGRPSTESALQLPLPVVSFLQRLAVGASGERGPFAGEADFLERAVLQGKLLVSTGAGLNDLNYLPNVGTQDGGDDGVFVPGVNQSDYEPKALSLHVSSSLVTEIVPLVLLLRFSHWLNVLILEEPEAHLHPHLQRVLAQVIARLVRKGVAVWLTTHSENFCQQINNFICLGTHPSRTAMQTELGYSSEDYLLPEEVGAYQFKSVGSQSELISLVTTAQGIAMPSFNEELLKLAQESQRLSESREVE